MKIHMGLDYHEPPLGDFVAYVDRLIEPLGKDISSQDKTLGAMLETQLAANRAASDAQPRPLSNAPVSRGQSPAPRKPSHTHHQRPVRSPVKRDANSLERAAKPIPGEPPASSPNTAERAKLNAAAIARRDAQTSTHSWGPSKHSQSEHHQSASQARKRAPAPLTRRPASAEQAGPPDVAEVFGALFSGLFNTVRFLLAGIAKIAMIIGVGLIIGSIFYSDKFPELTAVPGAITLFVAMWLNTAFSRKPSKRKPGA